MSQNTEIVESIQTKIAKDLLPAVINAEKATVDLTGGIEIEIPQQAKAQLKQKVNQEVGAVRNLLNQIQI